MPASPSRRDVLRPDHSGIHKGREPHKTWVVGHGRQAIRHFEALPAGVSPTMTRHNLGRDTEGASSRRARRRASDVPVGVVLSSLIACRVPASLRGRPANAGGGRVRDRRHPFVASAFARRAARLFARLRFCESFVVHLHAHFFAHGGVIVRSVSCPPQSGGVAYYPSVTKCPVPAVNHG